MKIRALFRSFTTPRITIGLLVVLALLLLLNVMLPQAAVLGEEGYKEYLKKSGPFGLFLLERLGFGHLSVSPFFLAFLCFFFLNLAAVLAVRIGPTWKRVALRDRSEEGVRAWARMEEKLSAPLGPDWRPGRVTRILQGWGFQAQRLGDRTVWAVKHRTAPLGFLLFHVSFFLLCAGGVLIYYTRFVGETTLTEGQRFSGNYTDVVRRPPSGRLPSLDFSVERVEPRFEGDQPVYLGATLLIPGAVGTQGQLASVNHPAHIDAVSLLVQRAGLSPILWLQDRRGFTLDRVATPIRTRGGPPTEVELGDAEVKVLIHPLPTEIPFPTRGELTSTPLHLQVLQGGSLAFDGVLRVGEGADLISGRLVLRGLRYWVGIQVIAERGGGLLIAGFVVGVMGLIWRLLLYRRELAVTWDEESFNVVGRGEYYSARFHRELASVFGMLRGEDP